MISRDGWAPYRRYANATHQTCVAHLLRRASGLIEAKVRGYSTVPVILKAILLDALALRKRRDAGQITPADLEVRWRWTWRWPHSICGSRRSSPAGATANRTAACSST